MGFFSGIADSVGVGDYLDMAESFVDNVGDGDWGDALMDVAEIGATAVADYYTGGTGGDFVGAAFDAGETIADGGDFGDVADIAAGSVLTYYGMDTGNQAFV